MTIHFSSEKRALIAAHRHLDLMRDQEIDAWDVFELAIDADTAAREQAAETLAQAKMHYDAACVAHADALLAYRSWVEDQRMMLRLATESAKLLAS